jgi:hypothetical protein
MFGKLSELSGSEQIGVMVALRFGEILLKYWAGYRLY